MRSMGRHPLGPEYALTRLARVEPEKKDEPISSEPVAVDSTPTFWYDLEVSSDYGKTWGTVMTLRPTENDPDYLIKQPGPMVAYRSSVLITEAEPGPPKTRHVY